MICDHAIECWTADKYKLGEEMRQKMIAEWKVKKEAVRDLAAEIRADIKKGYYATKH